MHTNTNNASADCASADSASAAADSAEHAAADCLQRAYGRKVQELLSQSDAATWVDDLWQMYSGYALLAQEAGHDPRSYNRFVSFRELIFFFQDVGKLKQ